MVDTFKISRRSILVMPLALAACQSGMDAKAEIIELSGLTMGTGYNIVAIDYTRAIDREVLAQKIEAALADVNAKMSNWDASSEVSRFNSSDSTQPFSISPELADVMQAAQSVHLASDGKFDVTIGPLIDLWGFGARGEGSRKPSDQAIAAALELSGQSRNLNISADGLQKSVPGTEVYLSAIGKGYGVDRVAQAMESLGLNDYMIEIGGDIYASGSNAEGQNWQIGIETPDPTGRSALKVVGLTDLGMATSGDYRNYFEQDGLRYSHLIDPATGQPVTHTTTSATVLTENAMLADAWATAMLVLGRERGMEIATELDLAVLFVERDANDPAAPLKITPSPRFDRLQA